MGGKDAGLVDWEANEQAIWGVLITHTLAKKASFWDVWGEKDDENSGANRK